jgi:hypothetical protein
MACMNAHSRSGRRRPASGRSACANHWGPSASDDCIDPPCGGMSLLPRMQALRAMGQEVKHRLPHGEWAAAVEMLICAQAGAFEGTWGSTFTYVRCYGCGWRSWDRSSIRTG